MTRDGRNPLPSPNRLLLVTSAQITESENFKMAGGIDFGNSVSCAGILEQASPSLQNCIQFSNSGRYFSALCDFGIVSVCELKGKSSF